MWQRPKQGKLHWMDKLWYDRVRVGHEPLERMLLFLSADIELSQKYTNPSIRATVMGILGDEYEGRIVIGWSGHKSEQTIKQYIRKIPPKKKKEIAGHLHSVINPQATNENKPPPKTAPISTITKPPEIQQAVQNPGEESQDLPNFQLEDLDDAPPEDILLQFLSQFDPVTENPPANPQPAQALQPSNKTMNINNVNNVQNVLANQRMVPNMFFKGNSNVTINYNFGPQQ